MTLKLGPVPNRRPKRISLSLPPDVYEALDDYAVIHANEFGRKAGLAELAAFIIERFLDSDAAFKRARKFLRKSKEERKQ